MNKANVNNLGYIGKNPLNESRDSDSWYTPKNHIKLVKEVLGEITLDPYSSEKANEIVGAKNIFTLENSAIRETWGFNQNVFMNPPYGRKEMPKAVNRFCKALKDDNINQAIVLVNNCTETQAFQKLSSLANSICLVNKRISFVSPDGKSVSGNTRGQVYLYFGKRAYRFKEVFSKIGVIF